MTGNQMTSTSGRATSSVPETRKTRPISKSPNGDLEVGGDGAVRLAEVVAAFDAAVVHQVRKCPVSRSFADAWRHRADGSEGAMG